MNIQETGDSFEDAVVVQDEAPINKELAIAKLDNFSNMPEMLAYADTLLKSKLLPTTLKTAEAVATVCIAGRELGMGPMAALSNIVVIQGRPTLGIHAIGALLTRAGVEKQTLEDFVPVMGEDGTDNANKVVDYRTTIRFTQKSRFGDIVREDVSFIWKDATNMDLTSKDNWKRMPKIMLWSRCMSLGARRAAPAAMLGMYETAEASEFMSQNHRVT